jgi:hypothetical protein
VIDPTGGPGAAGQHVPNSVYDGGVARNIISVRFASLAATATVVAAAPGLKTKLLGVHVAFAAPSAAGPFYFKDSGGTLLFVVHTIPTAITTLTIAMSGYVICETPVNSALVAQFDGTGPNYNLQVQYYQAP